MWPECLATLSSVHLSKCCNAIWRHLSFPTVSISLSISLFIYISISITLSHSLNLVDVLWPVAKVPVVDVVSLFCHCIMVIISSLCIHRKEERERVRERERECVEEHR